MNRNNRNSKIISWLSILSFILSVITILINVFLIRPFLDTTRGYTQGDSAHEIFVKNIVPLCSCIIQAMICGMPLVGVSLGIIGIFNKGSRIIAVIGVVLNLLYGVGFLILFIILALAFR